MGVDVSRFVLGLVMLDGMLMYMGERLSLNMDGWLLVELFLDVLEIGGFEGLYWKMGKN